MNLEMLNVNKNRTIIGPSVVKEADENIKNGQRSATEGTDNGDGREIKPITKEDKNDSTSVRNNEQLNLDLSGGEE